MIRYIKSNKKNFYCYKNEGIIDFSIARLSVERGYTGGNPQEALNKMLKNMKAIAKDLQERIEETEQTLSNLNQGSFKF